MKQNLIQLTYQIPSSSSNPFSLEALPDHLQSKCVLEEKPDGKTYLKIYPKNKSESIHIQKELKKVSFLSKVKFQTQALPFSHWAHRWKKGLKILKISEDLIIRPTWIKYQKRLKGKVVQMDPEMAFGTGHHATTRMCLEWISKHASQWRKICDVGCGSGILAISAVKLGVKKALAIDIDPEAVKTARKNTRLNRVSKKIKFKKNIEEVLRKKYSFDAVFANLTAKDIQENWRWIAALTASQGQLILAGVEASQIHWFEPWLKKQKSWVLKEQKEDGDWKGYFLQKSSAH